MMNEAFSKIVEFAFETLGIETIEAFTHKENQNSTKLLQKYNFEETGSVDEFNPNLILFRLSSHEWGMGSQNHINKSQDS